MSAATSARLPSSTTAWTSVSASRSRARGVTMSTRSITGGVALTFVLLLGACATTKLQEQWRDPDYRAAAGQKVMVVAVTGRDDRRRVFEDTFVSKLREEGVDAVPSYPLLSVIGP